MSRKDDLMWLSEPYVVMKTVQRLSIHTKKWNGSRCHAEGKGMRVHLLFYERSLRRLNRHHMLIAYRILQAEELVGDRYRYLYWSVRHEGRDEIYRIDTWKHSIVLL